jgi:hypothetical protein
LTVSLRNLRRLLRLPFGAAAVLSLLWLATTAWAQFTKTPSTRAAVPTRTTAAGLPAPRPGWTYPQRQTLTYEVDWRVFPAGTAVLHIESLGDSQRVTVTGDSSGAFNLLYRVSDHFQSTFNRQTGCSSGFAKQTSQGANQINYDQQLSPGQSRITDDEKTLITHTHHVEQTATPACVSDPLSAILYAASQPLQSGQEFHVPVIYGTNVLDITAKVEGQEAVRAPTTTYQALRVQPTWTNTAVHNSGNIWVWYSDDDRHIPVQVRARLFWGTITFRLISVEQK